MGFAHDARAYDAEPEAGNGSGLERTVAIDGPYDMRRSIGILQHGVLDPCMRWDAQGSGCWMAFHTAEGPVSLRLDMRRVRAEGSSSDSVQTLVGVRAWGTGAECALDSLPTMLGLDDDWSEFDEPAVSDTLPHFIRRSRINHPGVRFPTAGRVLDYSVIGILGQKVTGYEAKRAWNYLVELVGEPAPGPTPPWLRLPPTGEQWRFIPSWEWHRAGVDFHRSSTILRMAQRSSALTRLEQLPAGTELVEALTSFVGVGVWTAAEITQRTHGDADSVSVGDFHLAKDVGWALVGRAVDDVEMMELLQPWVGHRQRVVRLMYLSGFRRPRFAPRLAPDDHRHR